MLEIVSVTKSFGAVRALREVSLTVEAGEIAALLGPSGCGKSTLLAVVAGLEAPDAGEVCWAGEGLARVPPHRRRFGLMFQDYALFPHKDVFENVAFGLRMQNWPAIEVEAAVREALALVSLPGYERRDVNVLSGGEQQRVALARALAPQPRLLMLDEPLGALDRALREGLLDDLRRVLRGRTTLYVTHDQEEAFALADRVAVMQAGRIIQMDTPEALYAQPASTFVARFLGMTNLFEARLDGDGLVVTPAGRFRVSARPPVAPSTKLLIRPDAGRLGAGPEAVNRLRGRVVERVFRGALLRLTIQIEGGLRLDFEFPSSAAPAVDAEVEFSLDPEKLALLPADPADE